MELESFYLTKTIGGNYPGGNSLGGNNPGGIVRGEIIQGGILQGEIIREGIFRGGIIWGGIVRTAVSMSIERELFFTYNDIKKIIFQFFSIKDLL